MPDHGDSETQVRRGLRSMLVETSPDALIALAPDGTILFWSMGAEAVYGYSRGESVGMKLSALVGDHQHIEEYDQLIRQAIDRGLAVHETIHRKKDGSGIYIDITIKAVPGRHGGLQLITASHKDVTQIKVHNQAKILEARYGGLLESVPDTMVMTNSAGKIVLMNGQAESLFGYTRAELLGEPIETLLPERFRQSHIGHRATYFSEPRTRAMGAGLELFARHKSGSEFAVEISLSPLRTEEGIFTMSAIRDITDRKKLEQELLRKNAELEGQNRLVQHANRLKSEFLANMSHELRTPLNGIIGFAELMHDEKVGPVTPDHKEYLHDILTSGRHLLQLINDVLDLSKIEAGKMEFTPEQTDPAILVGEVCEIVRAMAAKKRIRIKTESDPSLVNIEVDRRGLKQILYNYISNALKFTPAEGKVTVRVMPQGSDEFRVEVEDTGVGIRSENLSRLFVEFQQFDSSGSTQYTGTGLGLALTKKIVEAQGGRVGVSSTPGQGSVFHATLPRGSGARQTIRPVESHKSIATPPGAPTILVVEDDADDRAWIAAALRSAGFAVDAVATGAEALVRCREQKYAAITLDIMLPDMSGRAVIEKLRERGLNQQTPVTVITLLADRGILAGFHVHDILSKPVSPEEIVKALERCGIVPSTAKPILIVDDDRSARKLADETLRRLGYRTVCRPNGASALRAASKEPPAAVVLDLVMPTMTGFEFLKRFRRTSRGRHIPVIVWTGKELTDSETAELRSAANAVAKKDEHARELVYEIQNMLSGENTPAHEMTER
jgi:PAS domain S-box-containing protein